MRKRIHGCLAIFKKLQKKGKNEKGSFTIEASLVFPIILLLTVAFILISVFIYERVFLYYIAVTTAERTTYSWNNSNKNPVTGEFPLGSYDDLYWRLTDDQLFGLFMQSEQSGSTLKVSIEGNRNIESTEDINNGNSLAESKLQNSLVHIPSGINGSSTYRNFVVDKKVSVYLENPINISPPLGDLIGNKISVNASSTITDPVEFIRTTNLIISNLDRLGDKDKIKSILSKKKKN